MSKNSDKKEISTIEGVKKKGYVKFIVPALFVVVGGLGYVVYKNPQYIQQVKEQMFKGEVKIDVYQPQIDKLALELKNLQADLSMVRGKAENPDFSNMNKKLEDMEQFNLNTIKSKADVETVLGLVVRMDKAEAKISDLAKITNKSALVLMSAMLVKDAAERGGEFVYEAEVLSEIVKGNMKIANELKLVNEVALTGIATREELQDNFADIYSEKYRDVAEEVEPKDWKERILQQVNKIIKVKKVSENNIKEKFSEEDRAWSVISDFVSKGEIKRAVGIAKKPLNENVLNNEKFKVWLDRAEKYSDFYDAISRISANSLAVMKVEFLNNEK